MVKFRLEEPRSIILKKVRGVPVMEGMYDMRTEVLYAFGIGARRK
jgi:hypothetical protein